MLQPFSFESFLPVNNSLFGTIAIYLLLLCFSFFIFFGHQKTINHKVTTVQFIFFQKSHLNFKEQAERFMNKKYYY